MTMEVVSVCATLCWGNRPRVHWCVYVVAGMQISDGLGRDMHGYASWPRCASHLKKHQDNCM